MPINDTARHRILTTIVGFFNEVGLVDNSQSVSLGTAWGSVIGSMLPARTQLYWTAPSSTSTTSSISLLNQAIYFPLTWTVPQNKVLSKLYLLTPSTLLIVGIINVPTPVPTFSVDGAYHVRGITLTLGEIA